MRRLVRVTWAGCGELPVFGPHPGTPFAVVALALVVFGWYEFGWPWLLVAGLLGMIVALYLTGAYQRGAAAARLADQLTKETS